MSLGDNAALRANERGISLFALVFKEMFIHTEITGQAAGVDSPSTLWAPVMEFLSTGSTARVNR